MDLQQDPDRLRRALSVQVYALGHNHFRAVGSGQDDYYVRLGENPVCTCKDAVFRGSHCKHMLAAEIAVLNNDLQPTMEWPDSLGIQACADLLELDLAHDPALEARTLTDPAVPVTALRAIAAGSNSRTCKVALTLVPDAARDAETLRALLRTDLPGPALLRLLAHCHDINKRSLFNYIVQRGELSLALSALQSGIFANAPLLGHEDCLPLLTSEDAEVRANAMFALTSVQFVESAA